MPISSIQFHPWTPPNEGVRPSQLPCIGGCGLGAPLVQKGRPSNFGRTWSASCMLATHFSSKKSSSSKARWNPVVWLATSLIFWWGRLMTTRKSWQKAYLAARQVQHLLPPWRRNLLRRRSSRLHRRCHRSRCQSARDWAAARGSLVSMKINNINTFNLQSVNQSVRQLVS